MASVAADMDGAQCYPTEKPRVTCRSHREVSGSFSRVKMMMMMMIGGLVKWH